MRPEAILPLVLAGLVAGLGLLAIGDAVIGESGDPDVERRRRTRAERNRVGQGLLGLGMVAVAAAIAGADIWRWRAVAALAGAVLVIAGALLNWQYLAEFVMHRGPARRRE